MAGLDNIDPANACCLAVPPAHPARAGPRISPWRVSDFIEKCRARERLREFQWSENTPYSGELKWPARCVC
jgi:hypothetical protein